MRDAVGIMDISGFGKYEITGAGARGWLDRMLANKIPKPGRMVLAPMLNERGTILGDFSLACLADDRFLMIGSGVAEVYHMRHFEKHLRRRRRRVAAAGTACAQWLHDRRAEVARTAAAADQDRRFERHVQVLRRARDDRRPRVQRW